MKNNHILDFDNTNESFVKSDHLFDKYDVEDKLKSETQIEVMNSGFFDNLAKEEDLYEDYR